MEGRTESRPREEGPGYEADHRAQRKFDDPAQVADRMLSRRKLLKHPHDLFFAPLYQLRPTDHADNQNCQRKQMLRFPETPDDLQRLPHKQQREIEEEQCLDSTCKQGTYQQQMCSAPGVHPALALATEKVKRDPGGIDEEGEQHVVLGDDADANGRQARTHCSTCGERPAAGSHATHGKHADQCQ